MSRKAEYSQDNITFDVASSAALSAEDFLKIHAHQYPGYSDENREKKLREVHAAIKEQAEKNAPKEEKPQDVSTDYTEEITEQSVAAALPPFHQNPRKRSQA